MTDGRVPSEAAPTARVWVVQANERRHTEVRSIHRTREGADRAAALLARSDDPPLYGVDVWPVAIDD